MTGQRFRIRLALAMITAVALFSSGCLSDVRPKLMRSADPDEAARLKGRELLARAAEAHGGLQNWRGKGTAEYVMKDTWKGFFKDFRPWPRDAERLRVSSHFGSGDSRVEFFDGSQRGAAWGVQSGKSYRQKRDKPPAFRQLPKLLFFLPTTQYFLELPFRIQEAQAVTYAGSVPREGRAFDLVLATWGGFEPNRKYDQYLVAIDRETGLIGWVKYTVRDVLPTLKGTIRYDDYREVDGIQVAFRQSVVRTAEGQPEKAVHTMELESVSFGGVPEERLRVDPTLPDAGYAK